MPYYGRQLGVGLLNCLTWYQKCIKNDMDIDIFFTFNVAGENIYLQDSLSSQNYETFTIKPLHFVFELSPLSHIISYFFIFSSNENKNTSKNIFS